MKYLYALLFLFLILFPSRSFAGGYQVSLHSHKNIGMGLIGTSLNSDASSAFYNPGALATLEDDFSFAAGISGIRSVTKFQKEYPSLYQAVTDNPLGTPFYFYASAKIFKDVSFGLAVNTPFGNSLKWEDGWAGRFIIQEVNLQTLTFQPTISYNISEKISVGAGLIIASGSFDMKRFLPVEDESGEGSVTISGSTINYGFNAGVFIVPLSGLNVGLSYRSAMQMDIDDAEALFSIPASVEQNFPSPNTVRTSLPLPANLDFGVSYRFSEKVMAGISLNYVFWSAYNSLDFDFDLNTSVLTDSQNPREYSNTLIGRLGGEYNLFPDLYVRLGAYFDPSPVNTDYFSPETPGLSNIGLSTGLSFLPVSELSIDLSLLYVMGIERTVQYEPENFNGAYKSRAYIPGIGISYQF
ncbi:MAG: OmpP1/FadL family transporter [Bacteroidales bacterium]